MSGKPRHKKGKHYSNNKGRSRRQFAATSQQPAANGILDSVSVPKVRAPATTVQASETGSNATRYQNIATELRVIGILAGITLIILVVLFLVIA